MLVMVIIGVRHGAGPSKFGDRTGPATLDLEFDLYQCSLDRARSVVVKLAESRNSSVSPMWLAICKNAVQQNLATVHHQLLHLACDLQHWHKVQMKDVSSIAAPSLSQISSNQADSGII